MRQIECPACAKWRPPLEPGSRMKDCAMRDSCAYDANNQPRCPLHEECDGTEPCPDCHGTGLVDLDAEMRLDEARRYLRPAAPSRAGEE